MLGTNLMVIVGFSQKRACRFLAGISLAVASGPWQDGKLVLFDYILEFSRRRSFKESDSRGF